MDPTPLATAEWTAIGKLITNLWIMVALVVFMATNVIIGLMFIPSLVASHQLPASVQKSRPAVLCPGRCFLRADPRLPRPDGRPGRRNQEHLRDLLDRRWRGLMRSYLPGPALG